MRLEVLSVLLWVPGALDYARRNDRVLHRLLDLVLQVLRMLHIRSQRRDGPGQLLGQVSAVKDGVGRLMSSPSERYGSPPALSEPRHQVFVA